MLALFLICLLLEGEQTRAVRKVVVLATNVGVAALVEELEVARVDGEGLVVAGSDQLSVADVVGPGSAAVGLAGEGVALGTGVDGPGAVEAVGGKGAEVTAVLALGLDDHQVLVESLEGVDLHGLEEVVLGVLEDDLGAAAEAAREVADGHAGAVDAAVVAGEEQVHVLAVTNDSLVNGAEGGVGDLAGEERLSSRPAVGVGRVAGGPVGELGGTPLVGEDPDVLGLEEEQSRGDSGRAHAGLGGGTELVEVGDGAEGHGSPAGAEDSSVDQLAAVVGSDGEVLERLPAVLGLGEGTA